MIMLFAMAFCFMGSHLSILDPSSFTSGILLRKLFPANDLFEIQGIRSYGGVLDSFGIEFCSE